MQSPTTTATYTTIPISGRDVISRSIHNLSLFISCRRPWPEFLASGVFDRPESLTSAGNRIRKNARYFRINYALFISACTAISLIGNPFLLIIFSVIVALWLVLYFFREDPLIVSDRTVVMGLVLVSVLVIWFTSIVQKLFLGVGIGLVISVVHGMLRNPDGLFMEEEEALANGLIRSRYPSPLAANLVP